MISWVRAHRNLLIAQAVAVLALVLLWTGLQGIWRENQNFDYTTYYEPVARRLLAGVGFREPSGAPAAFYPPGFSLYLAGIFGVAQAIGISEQLALRSAILLCTVVSVSLLYAAVKLIFDEPTAFIAALLWATYPFFLWLGKQPNSETPFMVFFLAAIYTLVRTCLAPRPAWTWAAFTGVFVGLASLVRPIAVVYALVCCIGLWLMARSVSRPARVLLVLCLVAGNVAAVLPWEAWVYAQDGERILLDRNSGWSLIDGMTFALHPRASGVQLEVGPDVRDLMEKADRNRDQVSSVGALVRFLASEARQRPLAVARLMFLKARRAWYGTNAQWLESGTAAVQIVYLALAVAGLVLLIRSGDAVRRGFAAFAVATVLYFWGMAVLVLPLLRYMIPAMSLLMVLIAVLCRWVANRMRAPAETPAPRR